MSTTIELPRSIETISPYRRSGERRAPTPATITGEVPSWLRGEVVRTCPAIFESGEWRAGHWFDGLGMIYAFRIGSSAIDFRSRLLESETARDAGRGESKRSSFGTQSTRSLLRRLVQPIPRMTDNTNVNIVRLGTNLVSLTEGSIQNIVDGETLSARGPVAYENDRLGNAMMLPHPHFDFARGTVVNVATDIGVNTVLSVYEHAPAARKRDIIASWKPERVPYVHAFGLTPKHAILVAHPFTVNPLGMLWSKKGYIDHFEWRPQNGTRLLVMDRSTGALREHWTDAFFVFHTVNAFESDGATVLDLLAYPDAGIVDALRVDRMIAARPDLRPSLLRVTMRPGVARASVEKLSDQGFEFPSTNYRRVSGQPYRFAWGAADGPKARGVYASDIVKVDVQTGSSTSYSDGAHVFGEPLFVANPQGEGEDDGVLLSVGSATDAESSMLAIVDAKSMALIAKAEISSSIPLGFHGSFVRSEA
jgi:beta,beta-carotene 9',10'-dioxygenase